MPRLLNQLTKDKPVAVPKKRTTKSTKGQRRSHDALTATQLTAGVPRRLLKAAALGLIKKDR